MTITERRIGDVLVLDIAGPLAGWKAATGMREAVARSGPMSPRTIVVNLANVRSIDLAGLDALFGAQGTMRAAGGEIRLASLPRRIHDLVIITRLLTAFDTFDSVEEAIEGPIAARTSVDVSAPVSSLSPGLIMRGLGRA